VFFYSKNSQTGILSGFESGVYTVLHHLVQSHHLFHFRVSLTPSLYLQIARFPKIVERVGVALFHACAVIASQYPQGLRRKGRSLLKNSPH